MKHIQLFILLALGIFVSACNQSYEQMAKKMIPEQESKFAEEYLSKLNDKDFEFLRSYSTEELLPHLTEEKLNEISSYFRGGELISTTIIGSQTHVFNGNWQGNFTFEYQFDNGWNIANAVIVKNNEALKVNGFNVYQTNESQKTLHAFKFSEKTIKHYLFLVVSVIVPLFIVFTLIICIRTKIEKRKWLWIIFVLFGFFQVSFNWTTGAINFNPISFQILGSGFFTGGPYSPLFISTSFPVGAIVFLIKRYKF